MIKITINNQSQTIDENTNLATLLNSIDQPQHGIAVAVNNKVVQKNDWGNFRLSANDQLLIIKATQGG